MNAPSRLITPADWSPFYEAIPDTPSALARLALPYVISRKRAVDLGCGKLNDTRFMKGVGFASVESVDSSDVSAELARGYGKQIGTGFRFVQVEFGRYDFGSPGIDWIHSNFALPYDPGFRDVVRTSFRKLGFGGVFSCIFFGPEDEPHLMHKNFSTIEEEELRLLLSGFTLVELTEHRLSAPFFGHRKQWHYFRVIARKT